MQDGTSKEWVEAELRRIDERFKGTNLERDKAIQEFKEGVTARFIQVNEFRGALDDMSKAMATRRELEALEDRLNEVRDRANQDRGSNDRGKQIVAYAFSAAVIVVAIAGVLAAVLSH